MQVNRDVARTLYLRGVRLNFPEFKLLMRCSIVTDHYLFQCFKAMFFGFISSASLDIENFQRTRQSLASSVYCRAHHGWARKIFQKSSQVDGKRYFELGYLQIKEPLC